MINTRNCWVFLIPTAGLSITFVYTLHHPLGACYCQILDCIIPGSVDMSKVKFDAKTEDDYRHNFSLLLDAFKQNNIRVVSICFVF